ncbi:MAG: tetratricopeptide repeat protein [Desulfotomaculales bacterium]
MKQEGNFAEAARSFLKAYKLARASKLRIILLVELSKLYRDAGHKDQSAAVLQLLHQKWPQFFNPGAVNIDSPPAKRTE